MFTDVRVIIVLAVLVLAVVAIHPNPFAKGVAIRSVAFNSSAAFSGIESPKPTLSPMSRERIIAMNNQEINSIEDYYSFVSTLKPERNIHIKTNKGLYKLTTREKTETTILNETELKEVIREEFDNETNTTRNITDTVVVNKTKTVSLGTEDLGLSVYDAPQTNIRKGLDLQGGTRVLLQPDEKLDADQMGMLLENMKYRLNVYGLSDIIVRESADLSGNQYVTVEIAGAKEEEVKDLLSKQGKFYAKIGNSTVFKGGNDIGHVCRTADCSGIDPRVGCGETGNGQWSCGFSFAISLSPEAAQRQAEATKDLAVVKEEDGNEYLTEKIVLYLDDSQVDELRISSGLKGKAVTDIAISGGGFGTTRDAAIFNALENMKKLQTVLITGSLPVKLNIVKTDSISPVFGEEFVKNALFMGLISLLAVAAVIFIKYRRLKVVLPILFISNSEILLLLGVAAIIGQNIDLAAVAGIIIAVGTGVNDQIIITDEALKGGKAAEIYDWKKRIKNAFFIIIAAFSTLGVAMVPLLYAGAGLLKGFAITTLIGASIGVFVTRPAYAKMIEIMLKND